MVVAPVDESHDIERARKFDRCAAGDTCRIECEDLAVPLRGVGHGLIADQDGAASAEEAGLMASCLSRLRSFKPMW